MKVSKRKALFTQLRESDQGVSVVFVALAMVVMMGFIALGIDISLQSHDRQELWDTLDAASLAGAQLLPDDAAAAYAAAEDYAEANWPGVAPDIDFWCVVGVNSAGTGPETTHIPALCDPGPGPYNAANYPGMECNDRTCFIPCDPIGQGDTCNTIRVRAQETVNFPFARIVGFDEGSTGLLTSASCKGPCGAEISIPGDIALVLDRTSSMQAPGDIHINALKDASKAFLEGLSPSRHHVALGTIGESSPTGSCPTRNAATAGSGTWVPVGLSDDYDNTDNDPPDDPPSLNATSDVVRGIDCIPYSSVGTNLGDSISAAGNHLLANGRPDVPAGVVFMTDGAANEPNASGNCAHAINQAQSIKSAGVVVVTIAYRLQNVDCEGTPATTVLATMASDPEPGVETLDDQGGCDTNAEANAENADGDLFFCAPGPGLLSAVFSRASTAILAQFADRTILVKPPTG